MDNVTPFFCRRAVHFSGSKGEFKYDLNRECRIDNVANAIAKWAKSDSEEGLADWLGWVPEELSRFLTHKTVPDRMLRARDGFDPTH